MDRTKLPSITAGDSLWAKRMAAEPLWDMYSQTLFPTTLESALYWANWLRTRNGDLVSAIRRGICYFLNGVEIVSESADMDSKDHYTDLLENRHDIMQQVLTAALDLQFYGNSFTSAFRTICRALMCPRCGMLRYLRNLTRGKDYDYTGGEFISTCSCHYHGAFNVKEMPDYSAARDLTVVTWDPLSISLDHCTLTQAEKITYIPSKKDKAFLDDVAQSAALETLPKSLLQALTEDKALEFKQGSCLHLALPRDAMNASELQGWGLPAFLPAFKYIVMLLLLERQTEAAVKDFILPIRLLFPSPQTGRGGSDPISMAGNTLHMGEFRASVERALKSQARQQASWQMIPAPVEQLSLGGDGKAIVPVELLQFAKDALLDTLCIPSEFSRTQFTGIGSIPPASLRNFEQTWEREVNAMDRYINWYLGQCQQLLAWPAMEGALMRQSVSSDPNKLNLLMQMAQNGAISQTTLLRAMNIKPKQERSRLVEDQVNQQRLQMEIETKLKNIGVMGQLQQMGSDQNMQAAMDAAAGGGAPPEGGAPPAAGGGGGAPAPQAMPGMSTGNPMMDIQNLPSVRTPNNTSPEQLQADAQVVAQILMTTPIGSPRNQIYSAVKGMNKTLYDIAKSILQQMEGQAKQQGVEMARQGAV